MNSYVEDYRQSSDSEKMETLKIIYNNTNDKTVRRIIVNEAQKIINRQKVKTHFS